MCNERERLIGYVYDECADDERRAIEAHLEECGACRTEIGGFRRVRQDLLAYCKQDTWAMVRLLEELRYLAGIPRQGWPKLQIVR